MLPREKNTLAALVLETGLCCVAKASLTLVPPERWGEGGSGPHLAAAVCLGWFSELQEVQLLA